MSVTYLVLAHRSPRQVARLAERLGEEGDRVLVHVDRKVDLAPFAAEFAKLHRPPECLAERVTCHWGGFGHVAATLVGMRRALDVPDGPTHLVLLTGQDYPLRSASEIRDVLAGSPEASFLSWQTAAQPGGVFCWDAYLAHLLRWHVRVRGEWRAFPPGRRYPLLRLFRRIPEGLHPTAHGSAYWTMTREAAEYCVSFLDQRPDVIRFFRRALIPDENLFQMILLASPLAGRLIDDDLRYLEWDGWHPRVLTAEDLDVLRSSGKLFARKFDIDADEEILDLLDAAATGSQLRA